MIFFKQCNRVLVVRRPRKPLRHGGNRGGDRTTHRRCRGSEARGFGHVFLPRRPRRGGAGGGLLPCTSGGRGLSTYRPFHGRLRSRPGRSLLRRALGSRAPCCGTFRRRSSPTASARCSFGHVRFLPLWSQKTSGAGRRSNKSSCHRSSPNGPIRSAPEPSWVCVGLR